MADVWKSLVLDLLILCIFILITATNSQITDDITLNERVHHLQPGTKLRLARTGDRELKIFCYTGRPKHLVNLWQTVLLQLDISSDKYEQYDGGNPKEVITEYEQHRSSWSINLFSWKQKEIKLNPFNESCVGIDSSEGYGIHLNIIRIDYWKVLLLGSGILLFFSARKLSNNSLFYYICGISVGVLASILIVVYMISKLLPKRPVMYGFVIGGWTVGVYFIQLLWENLRVIVVQYQSHAISYVIFTGLVSFVVCYRLGPVTDQRSKNLIKWALQGFALGMIFFSSHFQEATVAIIVIILITYNFPAVWTSKLQAYWKRKFPPKTKLLTEDEYYEQGVRETAKALEELRGYCSSPDCNAWKTVLKLKQPVRFASFMDGTSHLSDEELLEYESEARRPLTEFYTDDSDSDY
ncbi:nuclear envelope integral membrane protein isoform X2 [Periplaneta americana]|uniref:nuclear envelope integral membrane protein isoform X2 n=1 Tax=Periplaneta americana TaxID=6978 RepID=UPI0037E8A3B9